MYIDLIIIVVLLLIAILCFRRFSSFVYSFAIIDIFLRILNFIQNNVPVRELQTLIGKYFPNSIESVITNYSSGIIETILLWVYTGLYIMFLGYTIKVFVRKKK